jgi:hypothetical protein
MTAVTTDTVHEARSARYLRFMALPPELDAGTDEGHEDARRGDEGDAGGDPTEQLHGDSLLVLGRSRGATGFDFLGEVCCGK